MRRREFIALLSGVAAWPFAARAQQAKVPRIGVLLPAEREPFYTPFEEGLRRLGYIPGRTIEVDIRSAEGQPSRLAPLAAELVARNADILVAHQTPAVFALRQASSTIPIVMSSGDPVGTGLIESLARPGGNITGVSSTTAELSGKILELIREVKPATRRVALLANAADPFTKPLTEQIQRGATQLGIEMRPIMVLRADEFEAAFAEMARWEADAVVVQPSLPRRRAIELAQQARLPAASMTKVFAAEGGLITYAALITDGYRDLATYIDKVLKGTKPADLPVQQPTRFELAVNLKTAKAIGVTIPPTILARADEVIE